MKKLLLYTVIVFLILSTALPALAGTCYVKTSNGKTVNLRSEVDNSVLAQIPYGTKLTFDDDKSTEVAAYVTYNGKKGYIRWGYLSNTAPEPYKKKASAKATEAPTTYGEGLLSITATGAYIQFPNKKGKGSGSRYSEVRFDDPVDVVITASIPKGKKLAGWKINGVYMSFYSSVKTFRLPEVDDSITVEAVFR